MIALERQNAMTMEQVAIANLKVGKSFGYKFFTVNRVSDNEWILTHDPQELTRFSTWYQIYTYLF